MYKKANGSIVSKDSRRGFTIIEVIVAVIIIGILASIISISLSSTQQKARDADRATAATSIAEALENYYEKNGEYPSCPSLTAPASTVTKNTLTNIKAETLTAPKAESGITNSILCTDLTSMSQSDFFAYVGDSSINCKTGQACLLYKLKYKSESTGQIITIESRRKTTVSTIGTPTCSASVIGFNQIDLSWNDIDGAISYDITRAQDSSFTTNVVDQNIESNYYQNINLDFNTTYYYKVKANTANGTGNWCTPSIASTWGINAPSISVASNTATSVNVSWSSIVHAENYTAQISTDNLNWTTVCSEIAEISCNFTGLNTGSSYYFRVKANNGIYSSLWSNTLNLTVFGTLAVTCGSGNTTSITCTWSSMSGASSYQYQTKINGGVWSSTLSTTATSISPTSSVQGNRIDIQVRAVGASGNFSEWSAVAGANLTISTPAWNAWGRTDVFPSWSTWVYNSGGSSLCPTGTVIYSQFRDGVYGSFWNGFGAWGSNGSSSSTLHYGSTIASYYSTLQTEINGYCYNATTGVKSNTISSGISTTTHALPNVVLSGPVECSGRYSLRPFDLRLYLAETSYNLDPNQSNVYWSLYRYSVSGYPSYDYTTTWLWQVWIGGAYGAGYSNSQWFRTNAYVGATEGIASGNVTITHDVNGNANISYSASDGTSSLFGAASCGSTYWLSDLR